MDDVRCKGQLLEGLHCTLHFVCALCIKFGLRLALLLHAGRQQGVDVLQVHLLLCLTEASHLLSKTSDALTQTGGLLLGAETSLNAGESELRGLKPEVPGGLRALNAELSCTQTELASLTSHLTSKLLSAHTGTCGKLLDIEACLCDSLCVCCSKLLGAHTKLCTLQCAALGQLFCAKAKLSCSLRCLRRRANANLAELPGELRHVLLTPLGAFKSFLRSLGRALKTSCAHLRGSAALLFKDVSCQLCLCNSLTRTSECASLYSASSNLLLLKRALTSDVLQSLLHCGIFVLAHKGFCLLRGEHCSRPRKLSNALHCRKTS